MSSRPSRALASERTRRRRASGEGHAATSALLARRDTLVVASVSCIFGLGSPETYRRNSLILTQGEEMDRDAVLRQLIAIQYQRNDAVLARGNFRVRGDSIEIQPASEENAYRIQFFGDEVEKIVRFDPLLGEVTAELGHLAVYPASHYVAEDDREAAAAQVVDLITPLLAA